MSNNYKKCKKHDYILSCTVNKQGLHHSFNDEPSIIYKDGTKEWHKNGKLHRTNGPARIWLKENIISWFYEGNKIISGTKLSDTTFQYKGQVGLILENIEDKIYLGLLGDKKVMIGLEDGHM